MFSVKALNEVSAAPEAAPLNSGAMSNQAADATSRAGAGAKQRASYRQLIAQFERQQRKDLRVEIFWIATTVIGFMAALGGMFLR